VIQSLEVPPDVRLQVGPSLGSQREPLEAALLHARKAVFDETGVILPLIQLDVDDGMAPSAWVLSIGNESRKGFVEGGDLELEETSAGTLERHMADELRPFAACFISKELVEYYLDTLSRDRPILIEAVRSLIGAEGLHRQLADRVQSGQSMRNLPPVLDELLSRTVA
jgi:flagellar biosynthesis component FlhA